jgi:gamma-glutamyltranspeptidase/glutathione hydrolase
MKRTAIRSAAWILGTFLAVGVTFASEPPRPAKAAIASAHPLATEAGFEILRAGGNAFDAAVAVAAALGVVEPQNSGLGGGGFFLLHRTDGFEIMLDARERAPLAATRDMYLDAHGEIVPRASLDGPLAAGIPGTPALLAHVAKRYGRLPLAKSLAPAIRFARDGFTLDAPLRGAIEARRTVLTDSPAAAAVFLDDGFVPQAGATLRQPELAASLQRLAQRGHDGFYRGPIAKSLVRGVRAAGGIWTVRDLRVYRVIERPPIRGEFHGMRVTGAALPSSGGILLVQMLKLLEPFDLDSLSPADRTARLAGAMRLAYRDRARYLGDPDFVAVNVSRLLSKPYIEALRKELVAPAASGSPSPGVGQPGEKQQRQTTHFSVLDREGNYCAVTLSLNTGLGSAFMPAGTGVLLNNEMDDFASRPGMPNIYGLVGGDANAIAPGKRPLSSMSPTFLDDGDRALIVGTPGGARIPTMVLQVALDFASGRGTPADWLARPRLHHQYVPGDIEYEPGALDAATVTELQRGGFILSARPRRWGNMQAVLWDRKSAKVSAASDPRGIGTASVE